MSKTRLEKLNEAKNTVDNLLDRIIETKMNLRIDEKSLKEVVSFYNEELGLDFDYKNFDDMGNEFIAYLTKKIEHETNKKW